MVSPALLTRFCRLRCTSVLTSLPSNLVEEAGGLQGLSPGLVYLIHKCRGLKKAASQLRAGDVVDRNGVPFRVVKFQHMQGQARAQGFAILDMADLRTHARTSEKLRLEDQLELVDVDKRSMQVLYTEGPNVHLLDGTTFEQVAVSRDMFGDGKRWLDTPELSVELSFVNGEPVAGALPYKVTVTVLDAPALAVPKDDGSTNRHVLVDGGISVTAPSFVRKGDTIVVRTEDASYMTKADSSNK